MINNLREIIAPFFVGPGGQPLSPEEIARRREVAGSLLGKATDTSPTAGGSASVLAKAIQGLSYGINEGRADRAAQANNEASQANISAMLGLGGSTGGGSAFPPAPSAGAIAALTAPTDTASARVAQAHNAPAVNISGSQQEFVSALLPAAIEESKRTGIDPRIIVAQAAQETGWGRSAPGNNYFGIKSHGKGGGQTLGTHEYVNGKRVNIRDSFRTFGSPAESVRGYGDFILANPRYKPLMAAQGLDAQLEALQASGYATDPNYSRSVGAIARGIQLPAVDAVNQFASGNVAPRPASIDDQMAQELLARQPEGASPYSGPGATIAPGDVERMAFEAEQRQRDALTASTPQWLNEAIIGGNVGVAETEEDVLAQEAAMAAQDPSSFIGGVPVAETEADILAQEALLWRDPAFSLEMSSPAHVGVAETEDDILAQEALLSGNPAFSLAVEGEPVAPPIAPEPALGMEPEARGGAAPQGPGAPGEKRRGADGRMYQYVETSGMAGATGAWGWIPVADGAASPEAMAPAPVPQPSVQAIQALTGAQVNEALPMAGGANNVAPTINAAPSNPMSGLNPAVAQALVNPNASPQERAIAQSLLQQHMAQNQALQAQAQEAAQRAQTLAQRRGLAGQLGVNPDFAGDESIWKAATEASFRDAPSRAAGSYIQNRDGTFTQVPINPTGDIQEYEYSVQNPGFETYQQNQRRAGATNVTVGGQEMTPGWKKIDEGFGDTYISWKAGGWADSRKQIDQLTESLGMIEKAAREGKNISGAIGALPDYIQPFINPEGTIAREGIEEVVQRSLREILGAQFTEKEGERLIARAYNPRLGPQENAKRVRRLLGQVTSMGKSRQAMVEYFDEHGTLRGFKGKQPSIATLDALDREWAKEDGGSNAGPAPAGVDQSDWDFMTPEERALFQ